MPSGGTESSTGVAPLAYARAIAAFASATDMDHPQQVKLFPVSHESGADCGGLLYGPVSVV